MAAALFEQAVGGRARSLSAGTEPAAAVHPLVTQALAEIGIDLSHAVPRRITDDLARQADVLVTMGCGDASTRWSPCVDCEFRSNTRYGSLNL